MSERDREERALRLGEVRALAAELARTQAALGSAIASAAAAGVSWSELARATGRDRTVLARDHGADGGSGVGMVAGG